MNRELLITVIVVILFGVGPIWLGLTYIYAKDFHWKITAASDLLKGKESKRTKLWDTWRNVGGALLIAFGVVMIVVIIFG